MLHTPSFISFNFEYASSVLTQYWSPNPPEVLYPTVKWDGIEGSTSKRLYNDNFLKTQFMMPKVEEQERIGEYFEQLDHLITLHRRKYFSLFIIS